MNKIKEGIAKKIWQARGLSKTRTAYPSTKDYEYAEQTIRFLKENGVVQVDDERELPNPPSVLAGWPVYLRYFDKAQQDMLKANYKPVKDLEVE